MEMPIDSRRERLYNKEENKLLEGDYVDYDRQKPRG